MSANDPKRTLANILLVDGKVSKRLQRKVTLKETQRLLLAQSGHVTRIYRCQLSGE